jgi:hypothetical protein
MSSFDYAFKRDMENLETSYDIKGNPTERTFSLAKDFIRAHNPERLSDNHIAMLSLVKEKLVKIPALKDFLSKLKDEKNYL